MKAYNRRTGRARSCVNSDDTDYREHRMRSVYVRTSMAAAEDCGGRARNSRSMQPLGYFCFKCQQFWTDDQVYRIVQERYDSIVKNWNLNPSVGFSLKC